MQLEWSIFLQRLEINPFETLPDFGEKNPLYEWTLTHLRASLSKAEFIELYDNLFVECLKEVQMLSCLDQETLFKKIEACKDPFFDPFKKALEKEPRKTFNALVLYVAWEYFSINLACLFELADPSILNGIAAFRECFIESFQHLINDKVIYPSVARFVEALYAYDMRQEHLDSHSDEEWTILCEGAKLLQSRKVVSLDLSPKEPLVELMLQKALN